jgi:hypothetical protein
VFAWLRCWMRRQHDPSRHPLGYFRCADCGVTGASLDEMGFDGDGYVPPDRRTFTRESRRSGYAS